MTEKKFNSEGAFLKSYIMKQRLKKKQEMEMSISMMKQKREEEMQRFRVQMNLDEIKSELNKLETKLGDLKGQKHQLFSQLKKVLHEDDLRKRQWNANNAVYTAESLALAGGVHLAGGANQLFAQHMANAFAAPANNPSMQFYATANGQPIRQTPAPGPYQHKYNPHGQHMMAKGPPMSGPPPPPPSITAGTGAQRTLKRQHEESVTPTRGQRGVSPPVQTVQSRHLDYKSIPVTYTPSIPTDSRHPFPVINSHHWPTVGHPSRHPFGWSQ